MAKTFALTILTPDKDFLEEAAAEEITFGTPEGRIGVMAGHMSMIAAVSEGTVDVLLGGEWRTMAVSRGFADIEGDKVDFYVDTAEWAQDIDATRAREALRRAQLRMKSNQDKLAYVRTQAAIARALARIKAVESRQDEKH